ncbi:aryl hydrocarbon receptor-like [Solea senegalensis]|uniref:Aryl hydrocarbon receptor n=2 Tax=Solea senegalensis TaxID=28829 RepID=A0AAV6RFP6_SOLSE|nr:aryl hydrocarbon receptor-like [Solea senegalensis]
MLPSTTLYAVKKRKKPVQKIPKPSPPDGIKSNPSKRHRDRLNGELDKLTSLLPFTEEVRTRLDKLSVLRLSVGYLKVKSFFNATMAKPQNGSNWAADSSLMFGGNVQKTLAPSSTTTSSSSSSSSSSPFSSRVTSIDGVGFTEGDLLLQALNGFVLVITAEGYIFYTSPTIQEFLGFHQSDVIHQSVFELIHTDDRTLFRQQLHFALKPNFCKSDGAPASPSELSSVEISSGLMPYDPQAIPPENSSFLERNFCCRFRCLLDNSSGFLALNFHGRLKLLHGQSQMAEDGARAPPQLALFSIAIPLQPPSIVEIRTKTLIFQTKHKLDFTPMGIDTRGKVILGYNETELCTRGTGYHFIHAADMMHCADNHLRMIKTGDSGFTVFRLLTKDGAWVWVQALARMVFKGGKPDFIVARQRALTNEEGEEHLSRRRLQLPFNVAAGEALLYDMTPIVDSPDQCSNPKQRKLDSSFVSRDSILGCMLSQDQSIYCEHSSTTITSLNDVAFKDSHATLSVPGDIWQNTAPKPVPSLLKSEAIVHDMMETLQQILGDNNIIDSLDVEPDELKSWESTLLRMSTNNTDMSEDLNDILSNDILSYVEEQLQKEVGLKLANPLDDIVPASLSTLDLQSQDPVQSAEQDFSWPLQPQNQLMANSGQVMNGHPMPVLETMKLTHMDLPQVSSSGLKGPPFQQIASQLPNSVGPGHIGAPLTFSSSLADSCAQTQNDLRTLPVAAKGNSPGAFKHTNQLHSNQTQNHGQMFNPQVGLQDQQKENRKLNPAFNFQGEQWSSSMPGSNQVDNFVQTYTQNILKESGFIAAHPPSSCLQGHDALQTQNKDIQIQPWLLEEQQLITNGCQQMGACLNQMSALPNNPPPVHVPQTTVNGRPMFRTPETSSLPFDLEPSPLPPSSSCMFRNATTSVPVNRAHPGHPAPCKQINPVGSNQILSKPACVYQGLLGGGGGGGGGGVGGSVLGVTALPTPDESPLSCQMTTGLELNDLLVQQQQFLNFSQQTQVRRTQSSK